MRAPSGLLAVCLLLAGCGGSDTASTPSAPPTGPSPGAIVGSLSKQQILAAAPAPEIVQAAGIKPADAQRAIETAADWKWKLIKAGGVTQAYTCTGTGSPTVVYFNGLLVQSAWTWPLTAAEQAKTNRVCLFDRPGTGLSPQRPTSVPNGPVANADEALAMLDMAGEKGPFVFTGWSYGGLVARVAAAKAADDVVGLVLVDAVTPTQYRTFDKSGWQEAGTDLNMKAAEDLVGTGPDLGAKPLVVLEAGRDSGSDSGVWHAEQQKAAAISTNSTLGVVTDSQHQIPQQNPPAVTAAVTAAAGSAPVKEACATSFAKAGVTCDKG